LSEADSNDYVSNVLAICVYCNNTDLFSLMSRLN
jgi:hypothetical protein